MSLIISRFLLKYGILETPGTDVLFRKTSLTAIVYFKDTRENHWNMAPIEALHPYSAASPGWTWDFTQYWIKSPVKPNKIPGDAN